MMVELSVSRPEVFVIRANDMAFMGLLRSVHAAGSRAVPVVYDWHGAGPWYSELSRHFVGAKVIDNPVSNENVAVEQLERLGRQSIERTGRKPLALPSSDTILMLFLKHENRLSSAFDLMGHATYDTFRAEITHKGEFFDILQQHYPEVCPKTLSCNRPDQIEAVVAASRFPAVVKPAVKDYAQSFYRQHNGSKAVTVSSADELNALLQRLIKQGFDLLVQEKIEFRDAQDEIPFYAAIDGKHRIRVTATGIKEFLQPAPYGTATVLRLTWHQELLELASRVAEAIRWRGTLMIEFIRDLKDDRWKVVEVNTRPWLFQDFYRQFGLPFVPFAIQDHAVGNQKTGDACESNCVAGEQNDTIVPSRFLTETISPLHLDLPTIASEVCGRNSAVIMDPTKRTELLKDFVQGFGQNLTLAHGSADDIEPTLRMIGDLAVNERLDGKTLLDTFVNGQLDVCKYRSEQFSETL